MISDMLARILPVELEYPSHCPLCGTDGHDHLYEITPFTVVQCLSCSLGYLSPRAKEEAIMKLYDNSLYYQSAGGYGYTDYTFQERGLRKSFRHLLRILEKSDLTKGSLLEIGCGPGFFLDEAKGSFTYRTGMEMCSDIVLPNVADKIIIGSLDRLTPADQYDLIVTISVLEHVYNPVSFIKSLLCNLNRNGKVVIVTPDFNNIWRRIFRKRWQSFKVPEHVIYFNHKSLNILARLSGLKLLSVFNLPQFFPLSLVLSKTFFSENSFSFLPKKMKELLIPIPQTMICGIFSREMP
ncbi:MAG: class I SAM-dependent methyltransferase [Syntrophaceae bacterium]